MKIQSVPVHFQGNLRHRKEEGPSSLANLQLHPLDKKFNKEFLAPPPIPNKEGKRLAWLAGSGVLAWGFPVVLETLTKHPSASYVVAGLGALGIFHFNRKLSVLKNKLNG